MKKIILLIVTILLLGSCSDDENNIDCSLVDCFGGDIIELLFLVNNENVLSISPETEIIMIQNNESLDFNINTVNNQVALFLIEDNPITIFVDNTELNMEISSTFIDGECCSGIKVDSLKIDNVEICSDESCNEVLSINID